MNKLFQCGSDLSRSVRVSAVKLPSIVKKPSVPIAHVRAANPKNDPQDGTYHMATHEMTVIDPLHVAAMDPDDALTVEKHPESNAVPFSTESKKIKSSHKENHDPELLEIAMREFGKVRSLRVTQLLIIATHVRFLSDFFPIGLQRSRCA